MWRSAASVRILILAAAALWMVGCSSTETPTEPPDNNPPSDPGLMITNAANIILDVLPESGGWLASRDGADVENPDYDFFFNPDTGAIDGILGDGEESVNSVIGQLSTWCDSYNMAAFAGEGTFSFPHPDYGLIEIVVAVDTVQVTVDVPASCQGGLGLTSVDLDYIVNLSVTGLIDDMQVGLGRTGDVETLLMYVNQPETSDTPGTTLIYSRVDTAAGSAEIRSVSVIDSDVFFASNAFLVETTGADNSGFHYNNSAVGYPKAQPPVADGNLSINASGDRDERFGLLYAVMAYPAGPMMVESHDVLLGPDYEDLSVDGEIPLEYQGLTDADELILFEDLPTATFTSPLVD